MTKFTGGDDVFVKFDGIESRGEVINHNRGWVTAIIEPDPEADYGSITARLAPRTTVCVPDKRVRHASDNAE